MKTTKLKVYEDTILVATRIVSETKNIPKDQRYDLWSETKKWIFEVLGYIDLTNQSAKEHRVGYLDIALMGLEKVRVRCKVLRDTKNLSAAPADEIMGEINNNLITQITKWRDYTKKSLGGTLK